MSQKNTFVPLWDKVKPIPFKGSIDVFKSNTPILIQEGYPIRTTEPSLKKVVQR